MHFSGFALRKNNEGPLQNADGTGEYRIPEGTVLRAGGYAVLGYKGQSFTTDAVGLGTSKAGISGSISRRPSRTRLPPLRAEELQRDRGPRPAIDHMLFGAQQCAVGIDRKADREGGDLLDPIRFGKGVRDQIEEELCVVAGGCCKRDRLGMGTPPRALFQIGSHLGNRRVRCCKTDALAVLVACLAQQFNIEVPPPLVAASQLDAKTFLLLLHRAKIQ